MQPELKRAAGGRCPSRPWGGGGRNVRSGYAVTPIPATASPWRIPTGRHSAHITTKSNANLKHPGRNHAADDETRSRVGQYWMRFVGQYWTPLDIYGRRQTLQAASIGLQRIPAASVKHSVGDYAKGQAHTNGIESFWSMLKRGHKGTFHKLGPKHLDRYTCANSESAVQNHPPHPAGPQAPRPGPRHVHDAGRRSARLQGAREGGPVRRRRAAGHVPPPRVHGRPPGGLGPPGSRPGNHHEGSVEPRAPTEEATRAVHSPGTLGKDKTGVGPATSGVAHESHAYSPEGCCIRRVTRHGSSGRPKVAGDVECSKCQAFASRATSPARASRDPGTARQPPPLRTRLPEPIARATTSLYREYLSRVLAQLDGDLPPASAQDSEPTDALLLSSTILVGLFRENLPPGGTLPGWCAPMTLTEYQRRAFERPRRILAGLLGPHRYSADRRPPEQCWTRIGNSLLVSVAPFEFTRTRADIPDWLIDDAASASGQISLNLKLTEDFLGHPVRRPRRWPWFQP